jgi:hypothetical protein
VADGARQAQWEQARTLYPSTEYQSRVWADYFDEHPDVLTKLLGDVYRVYKTEEAKRAGVSNPQGGRRRSHVNGNLDELWAILTPKFSMDPFPVAVRELMGKKSVRQFAADVGMDHRELSRLLNGARRPSMIHWLEVIARGADVHPAFFLEWRTATLVGIMADAFASQPHLSITALKALGRRPA